MKIKFLAAMYFGVVSGLCFRDFVVELFRLRSTA
jgi:hypothetical protein